jgi:hypothetical protein
MPLCSQPLASTHWHARGGGAILKNPWGGLARNAGRKKSYNPREHEPIGTPQAPPFTHGRYTRGAGVCFGSCVCSFLGNALRL